MHHACEQLLSSKAEQVFYEHIQNGGKRKKIAAIALLELFKQNELQSPENVFRVLFAEEEIREYLYQ